MKKIIAAVAMLAAMTACCCGGPQAALEGTTWKLAKMEGIPGEAVSAEADAFTMTFNAADTMVSGRTNCNRFFGKYEHLGDKLGFGNLGMTRMACPDMAYEQLFVEMLNSVDRYEIEGATLKLYDDKKLLAEFRSESAACDKSACGSGNCPKAACDKATCGSGDCSKAVACDKAACGSGDCSKAVACDKAACGSGDCSKAVACDKAACGSGDCSKAVACDKAACGSGDCIKAATCTKATCSKK